MGKSERSDETAGTGGLLSRLTTHDLKSIKVAIRRHNVPEPVTPVAVQRNLGDPSDFVLCRREGEGQQMLFDRKGIVVNIEKYLEERIVLKSPLHETEEGPSHSKSYSTHEQSPDSYRFCRSPSRIPRKDKCSPSKSLNCSSSSVRLPFKGSKERERSLREKRENERRDKYSLKRYERNHSRSRSPKEFNHKHALPEKSRVCPKRRSVSPSQTRRRSRSYKRSPSPFKRQSSRSLYPKKMPPHSTSPSDHLKGRSHMPKKYSRSPHMTESTSHRYKSRSRSPYRRESDHRRQSRSPPKRDYKRTDDEKSYWHHRKSDKSECDRLDEFDYYSAEGFWIPQQGFLPRGMIPPPMGMMRPGHPYIIHRPYMHIPPHIYHQFRPRFSAVYHNRPFRPRLSIPVTTTSTIVKSSTTVNDSNVAESTPTVVVVEEPPTDTENVESTVDDKE